MPWTCPNSGRFAPHRIEQIRQYKENNQWDPYIYLLDDALEFSTFTPPPSFSLAPSSRQLGKRCTRQVHGVFSNQDRRADSQRDNIIRSALNITTTICVFIYFGLLIWGTIVYSQNTVFCVENQSINNFVLSMIILYWITPLWVPLLIFVRWWGW
eukprot:UN00535